VSCGGTRLVASSDLKSIVSETVWNDNPTTSATGGGVSAFFPPPNYQQQNLKPLPTSVNPGHAVGRCIPDVASQSDPQTGYYIFCDGQSFQMGGTSSASPLYTALFSRINALLGKPIGFVNTMLYTPAFKSAFRDITIGTNGSYSATIGYDLCSGLGVTNGTVLFNAFAQALTPQNEKEETQEKTTETM